MGRFWKEQDCVCDWDFPTGHVMANWASRNKLNRLFKINSQIAVQMHDSTKKVDKNLKHVMNLLAVLIKNAGGVGGNCVRAIAMGGPGESWSVVN